MPTETNTISWLFSWELDQERPTGEVNQNDNTVSYAIFPDHQHSFAIFEGHLFNKHNFRAPSSASDAERIIEYYKIFGEELFLKLRGAFSVVIWDAAKHRLIAGRDHLVQIPFYYFWDGMRIIISSSMKTLLQQPGVSRDYNQVVIAEHLLNRYPDHQLKETFFQNISRLPPAHYLKLENQRFSSYRYWNPIPSGFKWASEEESKTVEDIFEQAVHRCLIAGADSILLSGGIDSISLAIMANKLSQQAKKPPIHAVSGAYKKTGADEGEIQKAVTKALNIPLTIWDYEKYQQSESIIQPSLDMSGIGPIPNLHLNSSFLSNQLKSINGKNLSKLMTGDGGDVLFLVENFWATDLFLNLKFKKLVDYYLTYGLYTRESKVEAIRQIFWRYAIRPAFGAITRKVLKNNFSTVLDIFRSERTLFPAWLSQSNSELRENLTSRINSSTLSENSSADGRYRQSKRQILQAPWIMNTHEHKYFYGKSIGFSYLYPYFDLDLMDLVLRINPDHLIKGKLVKAPLHNFAKKQLPSIKLPTKKAVHKYPHELLRKEGKENWEKLDSFTSLSKLGIIEEKEANLFLNQFFLGEHNQSFFVWRLISTEVWLSTYS